MRILEPGGKRRRVRYAKVVELAHQDSDGRPITEAFVEVVIMGKNHAWPQWYPVEEFQRLNPETKVKGCEGRGAGKAAQGS